MALGSISEIDRRRVDAYVDRLNGARGKRAGDDHRQHRRHAGANETQSPTSEPHPCRPSPSLVGATMRADADDSQIYAYFAAERGKQGRLRQVRIELRTAS